MTTHILRPIAALLAGLALVGVAHADSGDEIYKRKQQQYQEMEKNMAGEGAFGISRKELDVSGCRSEIHNYQVRGFEPSYNCLAMYVQQNANGYFRAFPMPTAESYSTWLAERRAIEKAYPRRQAGKSAQDNGATIAAGLYDAHRSKLLHEQAKTNPFDGVLVSRPTTPEAIEAARAEVAKLTPLMDLLKSQVWRDGQIPTPDVQALQALRNAPALKRIVLGKTDAPVTVTLFADAGGLRSVAAIAEYAALANAGQISLELIPFAVSALSVDQNAALLAASAPAEAIDVLTQDATAALRNPWQPHTSALPAAAEDVTQRVIDQSRLIGQGAKLTYAPVAFIRKPGKPLAVVNKLAAVDLVTAGSGEVAFASKPLNDTLDPFGVQLRTADLSPAGRALLDALDASRKPGRPQDATTRLLDLVTGKAARQAEAPTPEQTGARPSEAELSAIRAGRPGYGYQ